MRDLHARQYPEKGRGRLTITHVPTHPPTWRACVCVSPIGTHTHPPTSPNQARKPGRVGDSLPTTHVLNMVPFGSYYVAFVRRLLDNVTELARTCSAF
jgi:hypothetical protein